MLRAEQEEAEKNAAILDSISDGVILADHEGRVIVSNPAAQRLLEQHLGLLQKADEAMMHWMHQYKSPQKEQSQEAAMQYLQDQLQRMEQVKYKMDSTLAAAQTIHKQHVPNK